MYKVTFGFFYIKPVLFPQPSAVTYSHIFVEKNQLPVNIKLVNIFATTVNK